MQLGLGLHNFFKIINNRSQGFFFLYTVRVRQWVIKREISSSRREIRYRPIVSSLSRASLIARLRHTKCCTA